MRTHARGYIVFCLGQKKIVTATATNFLGNYRNKCAIGHHCDLLFSTFQLNCCACHLFLQSMCRLPLSQTIDTLAQPKKNSNQMRVLFSYFFNFFFNFYLPKIFFNSSRLKSGTYSSFALSSSCENPWLRPASKKASTAISYSS